LQLAVRLKPPLHLGHYRKLCDQPGLTPASPVIPLPSWCVQSRNRFFFSSFKASQCGTNKTRIVGQPCSCKCRIYARSSTLRALDGSSTSNALLQHWSLLFSTKRCKGDPRPCHSYSYRSTEGPTRVLAARQRDLCRPNITTVRVSQCGNTERQARARGKRWEWGAAGGRENAFRSVEIQWNER